MPDEPEELYTIRQLAEFANQHRRTIEKQVRKGEIRAVRMGVRGWRIPRSEVERYLAGRSRDEESGSDPN